MAFADVIRLVGTTEHLNETINTSKVFRLVHLPTQKTKNEKSLDSPPGKKCAKGSAWRAPPIATRAFRMAATGRL